MGERPFYSGKNHLFVNDRLAQLATTIAIKPLLKRLKITNQRTRSTIAAWPAILFCWRRSAMLAIIKLHTGLALLQQIQQVDGALVCHQDDRISPVSSLPVYYELVMPSSAPILISIFVGNARDTKSSVETQLRLAFSRS